MLIEQLNTSKEVTPLSGLEELKKDSEARLKTSIEELPVLELKQLSSYLKYTFLAKDSKQPVILAFNLSQEEKDRLLMVFPHSTVELKHREHEGSGEFQLQLPNG